MKSLSGVGAVRRGVARGLTLGVLVGSAGLGLSGSASAANPNNYDLFAQGDGMYILFQGGNLPAGLPGAISPYAASATTNSNAVSKGFAGAPYLGPLLQTLPGLVGGLSGSQVPPLPPLPGFVESQAPGNPAQRQAQGPYLIESMSEESGSTSYAGVGVAAQDDGNPQAFGKANVRANDDGSTLAQASSGATGVTVGPVVLLDVSSSVSVASDPDGKTTILNQTNLGTISIAGIKIGLTESGFSILGATVDTPTKAIFDTINTVLAASKTKISLLDSTEATDEASGRTSVSSGGLRLQTQQTVPGVGPVSVDYIFGRSSIRSINMPIGGSETTSGSDTSTTGTDTSTTGSDTSSSSSTTGTDTSSSSGSGGVTGVPPVDVGGIDPSTSGGDTSGGIPPAIADPSTSGSGSSGDTGGTGGGAVIDELGATGGAQLGGNTELLYLVLVLGGAGAFIGQQLFSRFGVQLMLRQS